MNIHDLPSHVRPREKLRDKGSNALRDDEVLAILLQTGYQGLNAIELASTILNQHPLTKLCSLSLEKLQTLKGIGFAKATTIRAVATVAARINEAQFCSSITQPTEVFSLVQTLTTKKQENLVALYLDGRNQLITQETITIGTLNSSLIHARELFAPAIAHRAASLIMVHNHPSGELTPSEEDIMTTEKLVEAGLLLDIPVIDHIIVSERGFFSFKHHQLL